MVGPGVAVNHMLPEIVTAALGLKDLGLEAGDGSVFVGKVYWTGGEGQEWAWLVLVSRT